MYVDSNIEYTEHAVYRLSKGIVLKIGVLCRGNNIRAADYKSRLAINQLNSRVLRVNESNVIGCFNDKVKALPKKINSRLARSLSSIH